ncbi:MAG: SMP-30/gluconolactonase/LRE family protein [Acidimicrobiia bacterium]
MPARETSVLLDGLAFPEGPRWHDDRLFFSDMHGRRVVAVDMSGTSETIVEVPNQPSGLGWLADGSMLVVSMVDRKVLRYSGGVLTEHADLSGLTPANCNDMVVDARGRAYVGNFGFDMYGGESWRKTNLVAVEPDGRAWFAADELSFPNGTVVTPDNRMLIVGESTAARLTAFDISDEGRLSNRREWASLRKIGATPDGICLDADGAIWVACPATDRCVRVAEGGALLDEVPTGRGTFACALGGPGGRTLFICTADGHEPAQARASRSGRIETVVVDVAGA